MVVAVLVAWSAWLAVSHLEALPGWLLFAAGFAGGVLAAAGGRSWGRRASRRLGIQVTRTQRGRR